jgi:hypothetical protein
MFVLETKWWESCEQYNELDEKMNAVGGRGNNWSAEWGLDLCHVSLGSHIHPKDIVLPISSIHQSQVEMRSTPQVTPPTWANLELWVQFSGRGDSYNCGFLSYPRIYWRLDDLRSY